MTTVILVIHLLIALALVGTILLQRSEGGGLGMGGGGGGGGGMGGFMTGRATADLLTRTTGILAALFFSTSMILAILADSGSSSRSILDELDPTTLIPSAPAEPSAPLDN